MPWQYYGTLSGLTDAEVNALPDVPVPMPQTVDALFVGQGGIPLTGGGLVTQNNVKDAVAKIAYNLYGLPLTREKILAVPLRWVQETDIFDKTRPVLAAVVGGAGAALAPLTGGASLAGGAIVSKLISNNSQTYNPATNQQTTSVIPTQVLVDPKTGLPVSGQTQYLQQPTQSVFGNVDMSTILMYFLLGILILFLIFKLAS